MQRPIITRSTPASRLAAVPVLALLAALAAAPWWAGAAEMRLITEFLFYLALASLWNLLAGYAGLISVGQHAYVGLGGYALFSGVLFWGMNPLWTIPLAGALAAVVSVPVAWLVFRLRGPYFAIGTWVVAEVFRLLAAQIASLGGGSGLSIPVSAMRALGGREERELLIHALAFLLAIGSVLLIWLLLRSRVGLALTAIRDNETASASLGVRITRVKLGVYVLVATLTAMLGALIFVTKLRISPDAAFSINDWTVFVIFIVVIGGIGTIEGPLIGTLLYFLLREYLADLGSTYLLILGALAIGVMLVAPRGLWGWVVSRWDFALFPVGYRVRKE